MNNIQACGSDIVSCLWAKPVPFIVMGGVTLIALAALQYLFKSKPTPSRIPQVTVVAAPKKDKLIIIINLVIAKTLAKPERFSEEGAFRTQGSTAATNAVQQELYGASSDQYEELVENLTDARLDNFPYLLKKLVRDFLDEGGTVAELQATKLPILLKAVVDANKERPSTTKLTANSLKIAFPAIAKIIIPD